MPNNQIPPGVTAVQVLLTLGLAVLAAFIATGLIEVIA